MDRRCYPRARLFLPAALTLVLLTALIFGLASASVMTGDARARASAYVGRYLEVLPGLEPDQAREFRAALLMNGSLWLLLALAGLSRWAAPLGLAALFAKGFTLGYAVSFLLSYQQGRGALIVLLALLPHHILLLPLLLVMARQALLAGARLSRCRQRRLPLAADYQAWLRRVVIYAGLIALAALIQGYVGPLVLHLLFLLR